MCDNVLYHTLNEHSRDGLNELIIASSQDLLPAPLFAPTRKAARRFLEFFTAQINNAHTRRAYVNATRRFADWCAFQRDSRAHAGPAFPCRPPSCTTCRTSYRRRSVKQHLAAIRMLFRLVGDRTCYRR